ncbi:MAG TPA: arylamine N-acetyltransferase [Blastocatellia bacterium]|nr:arylamine N-acetyltransferase [Blastocatellia bacterium]
MDTPGYLRRMRYNGPLDVFPETLRQLHKAHLLAIPFENLDNHVGRRIVLDQEKVIQKLVEERRGGICYELNGAFCALLREIGFDVSMLAAGVARDEGGFDPPFDHLTLMVNLEQRWLADVGFGDSFREPLLLDERGVQVQGDDAFQLTEADGYLVLLRRENAVWKPQYRFTLEPHTYSDFSEMCVYHQTSPDSIFTQRRACSLATTEGRVTVTDKRVIITERGEKREHELASRAEWRAALLEHFGIDLDRISG